MDGDTRGTGKKEHLSRPEGLPGQGTSRGAQGHGGDAGLQGWKSRGKEEEKEQ